MMRLPVTFKHLLEGHDAGHYKLPSEIKTCWRATRTLSLGVQHTPLLPAASARALDQMRQAARTGKPTASSGEELLAAKHADDAAALLRIVHADAHDRAFGELGAAIEEHLDGVYEALKSAHAEVLAGAERALKASGGKVVTDADAAIVAGPESVKAWSHLDGLATRYQALQNARTALRRTGFAACIYDQRDRYGEVANLGELSPKFSAGAPPWPADVRARMLWLALPEVHAWMPTHEEQDEIAQQQLAALQPAVIGANA